MPDAATGEGLLRDLAPQVLGALVRRYGHFDAAEDAVQEALLAASQQWPAGVPEDPRAWLITVASRRLTDLLRSEQARRRREGKVAQWAFREQPSITSRSETDSDDTLILLFMCCHPSLTPASQIALTLRAVGGLGTAEVARAFMVTETTMARRISRAKQTVASSAVPFAMPVGAARSAGFTAVLHVLYLMFNEGYSATSGSELHRSELCDEAIRLTRMVVRLLPADTEVAGLLALMLLTDARRAARAGAEGELIPMAEQDRRLWDAERIREGIALLTDALPRGPVGEYQLQAAIAAVHDEAPSAAETDWAQIVALYDALLRLADNPMVRLNQAVAVAMWQGAAAGLALLRTIETDERIAEDHRVYAVRAHLLEMAGDSRAAAAEYRSAAARATSLPQQRYLNSRADRSATENQ